MLFQDVQAAGHHGGHLGHRNGTSLSILNLYAAQMPPIKFQLNPTYSLGGDVVWRSERNEFSNYKSPCGSNASHHVWAQSDLGSEADVVSRFSRWPPWWPSWTAERNNFSYSEFLCRSHASHQVSALSGLRFGRRCRLKNFKMAGHLGYRNRTILAILYFYVAPMPPIKFQLKSTYGLGGDVVWRTSRWSPWWPS